MSFGNAHSFAAAGSGPRAGATIRCFFVLNLHLVVSPPFVSLFAQTPPCHVHDNVHGEMFIQETMGPAWWRPAAGAAENYRSLGGWGTFG